MKKRVMITGLGTINALGNTPEATWERVKAGQTGVDKLTKCDTTDLKIDFGAEIQDFDPKALFGRKDARRMDPVTQYAAAAAGWALADAGIAITNNNRDDIGVLIGNGMGNFASLMDGFETARTKGVNRLTPFFVPKLLFSSPSATISIMHSLRGPNFSLASACAAGNQALGEAAKIIERGTAKMMLAGGSEAPLMPIIIGAFGSAGAIIPFSDNPPHANRPFDLNRTGFVMGEGAAVLLLEELEHAQNRGAQIYGEFLGYGASADAHHVSAPPADGSGAALAMSWALADAGISPQQIDYINAHGTGTKLNDAAETNAIKTTFGAHAYNIPISSTKPLHGHLLGGSGALEALICLQAMNAGITPPTINYSTPDPACDLDYVPNNARKADLKIVMSNGFGFGGHNASIILGKYVKGI